MEGNGNGHEHCSDCENEEDNSYNRGDCYKNRSKNHNRASDQASKEWEDSVAWRQSDLEPGSLQVSDTQRFE
ncbi:glycylpeptide N-tetradecanoyltransferase 1-like protein [Cricetulus griseus]|nr:glycylpeptide N-tetradecanoyltransferase 1-like protein [Cricetulus griseus]